MRMLHDTKQWLRDHRSTRSIQLTGDRRLTASIAFGFVFSAVAGFRIEMIGREGVIFATDAHANQQTPNYRLGHSGTYQHQKGDRLIVTVGVLHDISSDVAAALPDLGLSSFPTLHLQGGEPVISAEQANSVVAQIKQKIVDGVSDTGAKTIDLFVACPSFLALFLGHRLNATAPLQCYEWAGQRRYVPTCFLR
jgi:SMODS-associated and fused to various effectors sensor domain